MDQILLCTNHLPSVTTIYNSFIRNEMLEANGSYVKVYLYLNMCIQSGNTALSISSLADRMDNTEKDILRALNYWEKKNLIILQKDAAGQTITGIEFLPPKSHHPDTSTQPGKAEKEVSPDNGQAEQELSAVLSEPEQEKTAAAEDIKEKKAEKDGIHVTEEQIMRLSENDDFKWISTIVQSFLKRPVSSAETELLMYLYDNLQFSRDLILYLYEYCCTLGKTHVKYVQTVALSWAEQKISTPEEAKNAVTAYNAAYTAISKAFGLNRSLGSAEIKYADRWSGELGFELPVILEACSRALLNTQKADFKYTDSILSNWFKKGVRTLQDIAEADKDFARQKSSAPARKPYSSSSSGKAPVKNQFQAFQQRNLSEEDMNLLEKKLLAK